MPPFPAIENARIELNVRYPAGTALWGAAHWGVDKWAGTQAGSAARWEAINGKVLSYQLTWGADDPSGALTVAAAGSWECKIYDPKRELDPSNTSSRFSIAMKPGHPIRLRYRSLYGTDFDVRKGIIDEVDFDIASSIGTIRGTDSLQLMVAASMLGGQDTDPNMPTTLRAMAEYLIAKAGLSKLIYVERVNDKPDPTVGKPVSGSVSVWGHISTAAYDCLYAAWIDRYGQLRFRSFGDPYDVGVQIGGVDGIPVSSISTHASIKNVYTRIVTYDEAGVKYEASDPDAQEIFGDILLERKKPPPNPQGWADALLLDRSGAALQYETGSIYPLTERQLLTLLDLNMMDVVHLVAENVEPPFDISVRVLGGYIKVDPETGWTFELNNYIPANEWDAIVELPPDIEEPPPDPEEPPVEPPPVDETMKATRWYNCNKDAGIGLRTSDSLKAGQGADTVLAVGAWSGWKFRTLMDFDDPPWADVISVDKASIEVTNSDQDTVGFGNTPKVTLRRITDSWTQGSEESMHTGNAVVWPGPSSTSTGAKTSDTLTRTEGATYLLDCTAIVRAWFQGNVKRGIEARSYGEDNGKFTIEWVSKEGASPPRLKLELTVKKPTGE